MFADLHSDLMIEVARRRLLGEEGSLAGTFAPDLLADGVGLQFMMVGGDFPLFAGDAVGDPLHDALALIDAFWQEQAADPDVVSPVLTAADVPAIEGGALRCVLHLEGAGGVTGLDALRTFWRLGVRSIGLTWNGPNQLADGCTVPRGAGLTPLGFAVVGEAHRLGMVIDVAHLSERGVLDACAAGGGPVSASHANARAVHDHPRNLTDEQLRAIAASGGVVGVCAYPPMVVRGRRPVLDDLLRQVDHIAGLVGVAHVALGPDFIGYLHRSWFDSVGVRDFRDELTLPFPAGVEDSSGFRTIASRLLREGYGEDDVAAIMGANAERLLLAVLPPG